MTDAALVLIAALALDAVFGEPKWLWSLLPHPAVVMGRCVGAIDHRFNRGRFLRLRGVIAITGLATMAALLGWLIDQFPLSNLIETLLVAILLAQRSLVQHVSAVSQALGRGLPEGRRAVAMIVGRDTGSMDESAVARAAIESGAENLSDGVIAPAFWFLLGGLPGILVYKIVNTADSMIGYRTPRHEAFGWAAARLDDLLNLVPARLTAMLILVRHAGIDLWRRVRSEAVQHRSPNAGWPEAAMAQRIGVALSGPRSYDGRMRDFPFVNAAGNRTPGARDIEACVSVLWQSWALLVILVGLIAIF